MRTNKLIRHGHMIFSHYDDVEGLERHDLYWPPDGSELADLSRRGKDTELSIQIRDKRGSTKDWVEVGNFSTLAQALKAAKTRLMFCELKPEERQEILRAIYSLVETDNAEGE